jgi:phospholipid-binding lipoprotein MlaA
MGLKRRSEDFGQTLGRWGVGPGPFLMLPLLGPSTARDAVGSLADRQVGPAALPPTTPGRLAVTAVEAVDVRTRLLAAGALLDQVALDRYSFLRDAYLAARQDAVYDGAPPLPSFGDDPGDPGDARDTSTKSQPRAAAAAQPAASAASAAAR